MVKSVVYLGNNSVRARHEILIADYRVVVLGFAADYLDAVVKREVRPAQGFAGSCADLPRLKRERLVVYVDIGDDRYAYATARRKAGQYGGRGDGKSQRRQRQLDRVVLRLSSL